MATGLDGLDPVWLIQEPISFLPSFPSFPLSLLLSFLEFLFLASLLLLRAAKTKGRGG